MAISNSGTAQVAPKVPFPVEHSTRYVRFSHTVYEQQLIIPLDYHN